MAIGSRPTLIALAMGAALALALPGCQSVQKSIEDGNFIVAEELAAKSRGEARLKGYRLLAEACILRGDYPGALRFFTAIEDHQGLFSFAQSLDRRLRDGEIAVEGREETLVAVFVAYRRAAQFAKRYMDANKGLPVTAERAIAPEGMRFAIWLGVEDQRYIGSADAMAEAAAMDPAEAGEFIGKELWAYYQKDPDRYGYCLPIARDHFKKLRGMSAWRKLVEDAMGHEFSIAKRYDEAMALYESHGESEAGAAARIGYDLLSPRGRKSYDAPGILDAMAWFERAGDEAGRAKAELFLCDAYLRSGEIEKAEGAFIASGGNAPGYAEALAEAWAGASEKERAARWYRKAGREDAARQLYFELAEERIQARDCGAALGFLEESGRLDNAALARFGEIAAWYDGRGEHEVAAALFVRAGEAEEAVAAYRRAVSSRVALGEYDKAIELGKASGDASVVDDAYRGKAASLLEGGKRKEAVEALMKPLESRGRAVRLCVEAIAERALWKELPAFLSLTGQNGFAACRATASLYELREDYPSAIRLFLAAGDKDQASRIAADAIREARRGDRFADAAEIAIAAGADRGAAYSDFAAEALEGGAASQAAALFELSGEMAEAERARLIDLLSREILLLLSEESATAEDLEALVRERGADLDGAGFLLLVAAVKRYSTPLTRNTGWLEDLAKRLSAERKTRILEKDGAPNERFRALPN